ncbi:MAG: glutathione S-transferase family protein [Gammaproteobacteria bacterium]
MNDMSSWPAITLRYFDCRGRAQYLRYYLRARGIPFTDERVPLSAGFPEWMALKPDRNRSGPFGKLPVLHWGDTLVAETPVIHDWLQRKSGDATRLSEEEQLQHAMLVSSCLGELLTPLGTLLYCDLAYQGTDLATAARNALPRLQSHLQAMDQALTQWQWHGKLLQRGPMLADCMLWDLLHSADLVFGPALQLDRLPSLNLHYAECPGRNEFMALLAEHPDATYTARPDEAGALARIRDAVNMAA